MANVPTVFVSSTFYDLQQIRTDLSEFLENQLGYRALLSEKSSFPVDPDLGTIENCRRRVEEDADVLVLIIGGRYGYVSQDADKSVTNLEYLTAHARGLPVYAFVEKRVLSLLPVWEANKAADFSVAVDNPLLFEFIRQVREAHAVWMFEFECAQDIVRALRTQLAYRMHEGLSLEACLRDGNLQKEWEGLGGKAFRTLLEKSAGWEFLLFGQVLSDELQAYQQKRFQHKMGLTMGPGESIALLDTLTWMQARLAEVGRIATALGTLINEAFQQAIGPPGTAGDARDIISVARQIALVYSGAIDWSQQIRRAHVDPIWEQCRNLTATWADDMIQQTETIGPELTSRMEAARQSPLDSPLRKIDLQFTLASPDVEAISREMDVACQQLGLRP